MTKSRFLTLTTKLGLLFVLYTLMRVVFLYLNWTQFQKFSWTQILASFFTGLRFDLSAILLLNLVIVLWALVPTPQAFQTWHDRIQASLFFLINIPFILLNMVDTEYYKFTGMRMTLDILLLRNEATNQLDNLAVSFWHILLIDVVLLAGLVWGFRRWARRTPSHPGWAWPTQVGFSFLVFAVTIFGIRGGTQKKVLKPFHAYTLGHAELGTLALNSTFTLLKSKLKPELEKVNYFSSDIEVYKELAGPDAPASNTIKKNKPKQNIVILILESFATEFWGHPNPYQGYTPFLDSLAQKGLFFKNNFADGRRSIEALPAILLGVPSLMSTPVSKSTYQQNEWHGLGTLLQKHGYHTSFFHGADAGTMYFDAISAQAGLADYYPKNRYPNENDFDGNWGIFDEPFLQYMVKNLNQHPEPFFSTVFTISSHQPYQVPPEYLDKFPKGELKIHPSIGYVDYAVQKFFESAEQQPWFENTLFIITGDHTQMSKAQYYNSSLGGFMVPLLFYHPTRKLKHMNSDRITHHSDLPATVLDYLQIQGEPRLLFGRSIFDLSRPGEAILHLDGNYWLVREDHFMRMSLADSNGTLYRYPEDRMETSPVQNTALKEEFETRLKAYIQYFKNGLIENSLYDWPEALAKAQQ